MQLDAYPQTLTVIAEKYDHRIHIEWEARLVREDAWGVVTFAPLGTDLVHHTRGFRLPQDHHCLSLFPRDRWWNAMLDFDAAGQFLAAYCNVCLPYSRDGQVVRWIDLDLDVLLYRDHPAALLDEDEFVAHARQFHYPATVVAGARAAAADLLDRASRGALPFRHWALDAALAYLTDPDLRPCVTSTPSRQQA